MYAVKLGNHSLAKKLLQLGADVNKAKRAPNSPLFAAFNHIKDFGDDAMVRTLLEWGADTEIDPIFKMFENPADFDGSPVLEWIKTPLGGRRCELIGLQQDPAINGMVGVAGDYKKDKDRYVFTTEGTNRKILVRPRNLKRRDRTPSDPGN